jgi:hypothetical protein
LPAAAQQDQYNTVRLIDRSIDRSTAQHSTAQHSTAQHSTAQHSTAQHSTAQQIDSIKIYTSKIDSSKIGNNIGQQPAQEMPAARLAKYLSATAAAHRD